VRHGSDAVSNASFRGPLKLARFMPMSAIGTVSREIASFRSGHLSDIYTGSRTIVGETDGVASAVPRTNSFERAKGQLSIACVCRSCFLSRSQRADTSLKDRGI
jgi:hypothetical protein